MDLRIRERRFPIQSAAKRITGCAESDVIL